MIRFEVNYVSQYLYWPTVPTSQHHSLSLILAQDDHTEPWKIPTFPLTPPPPLLNV